MASGPCPSTAISSSATRIETTSRVYPSLPPFFVPGNHWEIYGPQGFGLSLWDTLAGQMQYTYFPITLDQLGATAQYHELVEGTCQIGDIQVRTHYLNHPALTLGYRMEADIVDAAT